MSPGDDRVAVAARVAVDVAARYGVHCPRPRLLHHSNNIVWHLTPTPIVAKVAASLHRQGRGASLARELEVGRFLATRDAPTTRPTCALPAGPHEAHDTVVTFWEYCVHDEREVDARSAARALAGVHAALAGYDGPLPPFTLQFEDAGGLLDNHPLPALAREDRAFLAKTHLSLSAALTGRPLVMRPLHGEAHLGNVLSMPEGPRWFDFEAACLGPVEWDLAGLGEDALDPSADVDCDLLELMGRLRSLCVAVWCSMSPDRSPELREAAEHHLRRLQGDG